VKTFIVGLSGSGHLLALCLKARSDHISGRTSRPEHRNALCRDGITQLGTIPPQLHWRRSPIWFASTMQSSLCRHPGQGRPWALTTSIDGNGAVKTIAAARHADIRSVILVSKFPDA